MSKYTSSKKAPKTSLEKSHSAVSNFKLTLICIIAELGFAALFAGLALAISGAFLPATVSFIIAGAGAAASLFAFVMLYSFKR